MTGSAVFFLTMSSIAAAVLLLRTLLARRGSGLLAQRRFKQVHGARVAALLDGSVDPRAGSPWIAVRLGGRQARMVAAPIVHDGDRTLQAGVELVEWQLPAQIWHTGGDEQPDADPGVDAEALRELVTALAALDVDSVAAPAMPADVTERPPHVLRMRFARVDALPERFEQIAGLLERLEALGHGDQVPNV